MMNNTSQKPIQPVRGAIYYCNLGENPGSVQDGYRPVLVISSNDICRTSPVVTIAPITSVLKRTDLPGHVLLPTDCEALTKPSMLLLEQPSILTRISQLPACVPDAWTITETVLHTVSSA